MAGLRLVALGGYVVGAVVIATVGCRASEAGPTSGLTPPAGWQAMPSIAEAAKKAATESGIVVDGSEAWGEPSRGCYGAWIAMTGGRGGIVKMADELVASLSSEPSLAGIAVRDVVKPTAGADGGVMSLAFDRPPYHGKLRALIGKDGRISMLACFWNEREPIACEATCAQLVGSLK